MQLQFHPKQRRNATIVEDFLSEGPGSRKIKREKNGDIYFGRGLQNVWKVIANTSNRNSLI